MSSQDGSVKYSSLQDLTLEAIDEFKASVGSRLDDALIRLCVEEPKWRDANVVDGCLHEIELKLVRARALVRQMTQSFPTDLPLRRPAPASEDDK